jgi:hypothetical protein
MLRYNLTILLLSSILFPVFSSCTSEDKNKNPPVFTSVPGTEASEGVAYPYPIDCTDPDGNVTNVTVGALDTCGGTIGAPGSDDPYYDFTPDESAGGTTCLMHLICDDGKHTVEQTQEITIAEVNEAPEFLDLPASGAAHFESTGSLTLTAYDSDLPLQGLLYSIDSTACPFPVTLDENNEIAWTCGSVVESCALVATVTDDGSPVQQTSAEVLLECVNAVPVFDSVPVTSVNEGDSYFYEISCSDPDSDPVMLSVDELDSCMGLFETNGGGLATYGFDTFETDGGTSCTASFACHDSYGGFSIQTFGIDIVDTNHAPVITNLPSSIQTAAEAAGSKWVTVMDPDDPVQTITWSVLASSCSFATAISVDGVASWTCGDPETCEINVRATDNGTPALSDTQTLQITCYPN